jgi:hypothetical protein
MKTRGVKKRPGHSTVEIDGDVHEFVSSDRSHPQAHLSTQMFYLLDQQRTTFTEATGTGKTLNYGMPAQRDELRRASPTRVAVCCFMLQAFAAASAQLR